MCFDELLAFLCFLFCAPCFNRKFCYCTQTPMLEGVIDCHSVSHGEYLTPCLYSIQADCLITICEKHHQICISCGDRGCGFLSHAGIRFLDANGIDVPPFTKEWLQPFSHLSLICYISVVIFARKHCFQKIRGLKRTI